MSRLISLYITLDVLMNGGEISKQGIEPYLEMGIRTFTQKSLAIFGVRVLSTLGSAKNKSTPRGFWWR